MHKTSLSVLVPAFNEEALIGESLKRLLALGESPLLERVQVIVVNDASTDRTREEAERFIRQHGGRCTRFEWRLVDHDRNRGKGEAVRTALACADQEVTVIHDADLEYYPGDILKMIPLFLEEGADAVFGSRFAAAEFRRVLLFRHELGNKLITFLCNLVSNLNLTDIETCYKAVRTRLLKSIPLESNDFRIEPEIAIKLAKRRAKIYEVSIRYSGRTYAEGKKIRWRDGWRAIAAIARFGLSDNVFNADPLESQILFRLSRARRFNRWMADTIRPYVGDCVLEIGAGIGNITAELMTARKYFASDINSFYLEMLDGLKAHNPRLKTALVDLRDLGGLALSGARFDTVVCLNVIEHLEDDRQALHNIASVLNAGGRAIVLVPGGPWLYGSLDEVLGHKRRYTEKMLRELASACGLRFEALVRFNRASSLPWFVNGRVLRRRSFSRIQLAVLELLMPLIRRLDRHLPWPPLSLIAVFLKAGCDNNFANPAGSA
jgi:glycosyltransferase involved in cell wall biosynthesis